SRPQTRHEAKRRPLTLRRQRRRTDEAYSPKPGFTVLWVSGGSDPKAENAEPDHAASRSLSATTSLPASGRKESSQSVALLAREAARTMARESSRRHSSQAPI